MLTKSKKIKQHDLNRHQTLTRRYTAISFQHRRAVNVVIAAATKFNLKSPPKLLFVLSYNKLYNIHQKEEATLQIQSKERVHLLVLNSNKTEKKHSGDNLAGTSGRRFETNG